MDPKHLNKSQSFINLSGEVNDNYGKWHSSIKKSNNPFDRKITELMALCAACAIKCHYCIEAHSQKARSLGATEEEIAKTIQIASMLGSGSVMAYGIDALSGK